MRAGTSLEGLQPADEPMLEAVLLQYNNDMLFIIVLLNMKINYNLGAMNLLLTGGKPFIAHG